MKHRNSPMVAFYFVMAATTIALMPVVGIAFAFAGLFRCFGDRHRHRQLVMQQREIQERAEFIKACLRI